MANITRKIQEETPEEIVERIEEAQAVNMEIDPFPLRMAKLGALIRAEAPSTLKFDSTVDNINYDYVDTQQYKNLVGTCCDKVGVGALFNVTNERFEMTTDARGVTIYTVSLYVTVEFYDPFATEAVTTPFRGSAFGMGVSRGNAYAAGIAQTNAMRNLLTNFFMIPTSDRESDDVNAGADAPKNVYMTESEKAVKREKLMESTQSTALYATIQYGNIVYKRIQETLEKNIPDSFRETLTTFVANKFKDGKPLAMPEDDSLWIVKKTAANKILSDLDAY